MFAEHTKVYSESTMGADIPSSKVVEIGYEVLTKIVKQGTNFIPPKEKIKEFVRDAKNDAMSKLEKKPNTNEEVSLLNDLLNIKEPTKSAFDEKVEDDSKRFNAGEKAVMGLPKNSAESLGWGKCLGRLAEEFRDIERQGLILNHTEAIRVMKLLVAEGIVK